MINFLNLWIMFCFTPNKSSSVLAWWNVTFCLYNLSKRFYCEGFFIGLNVSLLWAVKLCLLRRDSVHAYRQHGIRSGSRSFHDPSQRPGHHDHPHLPPLALLQADRGARRGGPQGTSRESVTVSNCLLLLAHIDHKPAWDEANESYLVFGAQIMLSRDARNTAWVSFDGRKRQEICHGDRLVHVGLTWARKWWSRGSKVCNISSSECNSPSSCPALTGFVT